MRLACLNTIVTSDRQTRRWANTLTKVHTHPMVILLGRWTLPTTQLHSDFLIIPLKKCPSLAWSSAAIVQPMCNPDQTRAGPLYLVSHPWSRVEMPFPSLSQAQDGLVSLGPPGAVFAWGSPEVERSVWWAGGGRRWCLLFIESSCCLFTHQHWLSKEGRL